MNQRRACQGFCRISPTGWETSRRYSALRHEALTIGVILHGKTIAPFPVGHVRSCRTRANATNAEITSSKRYGDQVCEAGQTLRVGLEKMVLNSSLAAMNAAAEANTVPMKDRTGP
jgi:hypothetical protein